VKLCPGPYGGPRGSAVSYERGTPGADYLHRKMILPNRTAKTKGTFVKQYRKMIQPTASLFEETREKPRS